MHADGCRLTGTDVIEIVVIEAGWSMSALYMAL